MNDNKLQLWEEGHPKVTATFTPHTHTHTHTHFNLFKHLLFLCKTNANRTEWLLFVNIICIINVFDQLLFLNSHRFKQKGLRTWRRFGRKHKWENWKLIFELNLWSSIWITAIWIIGNLKTPHGSFKNNNCQTLQNMLLKQIGCTCPKSSTASFTELIRTQTAIDRSLSTCPHWVLAANIR